MTLTTTLTFKCPGCKTESTHPLQTNEALPSPTILGPVAQLRVRSERGERTAYLVPAICPACGLVSFFDAAVLATPPPPSTAQQLT